MGASWFANEDTSESSSEEQIPGARTSAVELRVHNSSLQTNLSLLCLREIPLGPDQLAALKCEWSGHVAVGVGWSGAAGSALAARRVRSAE